jgi:protein-L-isoaspartate(D-aspartate) O-methyltransferase
MIGREKAQAKFLATLKRGGISDERVLAAMKKIPREQFVAKGEAPLALDDRALPIACGQTISQPYVVAAMTEALELSPSHKVLEIGTGSGYQAAILASLVKEVVSVERYPALAASAREKLKNLDIKNVTVIKGDGTEGAGAYAPFDRIIVTAASEAVPAALIGQLAVDGVLVAPIGPAGGVQTLTRFRKAPDNSLKSEELMAVRFVPLLPGIGGIR